MILEAKGLALNVPGKQLFDQLNVAFSSGQCWAVIGPNGSGKTTLLHALAGIAPVAAGAVYLNGARISALPRRTLARSVGLLLQEEFYSFGGSVAEYVAFGRFPHSSGHCQPEDERIIEFALQAMNLRELAYRPFISLSGGEKQRAKIAMLLAQQPEIYLVDEPLQNLDLSYQAQVVRVFTHLARVERKLVVMVVHELTWLSRFCDQALLLGENSIISGPGATVLNKENLECLYGYPLQILHSEEGGDYFFPA